MIKISKKVPVLFSTIGRDFLLTSVAILMGRLFLHLKFLMKQCLRSRTKHQSKVKTNKMKVFKVLMVIVI